MSFVNGQVEQIYSAAASARVFAAMIAQGWGRGPLDVGDQALMRGFEPQFRVSSGALPRLRTGVDLLIGHLQSSGIPLPRLRPRRCAMFVVSLFGWSLVGLLWLRAGHGVAGAA
jgi:hypothetical protein